MDTDREEGLRRVGKGSRGGRSTTEPGMPDRTEMLYTYPMLIGDPSFGGMADQNCRRAQQARAQPVVYAYVAERLCTEERLGDRMYLGMRVAIMRDDAKTVPFLAGKARMLWILHGSSFVFAGSERVFVVPACRAPRTESLLVSLAASSHLHSEPDARSRSPQEAGAPLDCRPRSCSRQ